MTDDPRALDGGPAADQPDDELVSAYIDGEASADERALVEHDPHLLERAATFSAVGDALREVTPLTPDQRDDMLATVRRRLDQPVAPVIPARRRRAGFDPARVVAVAAAVVMIGLLGGALAMLGGGNGGDDQDASTTAGDAADVALADDDGGDLSVAESAPEDETNTEAGIATTAGQPVGNLGEFATETELEDTARSAATAYVEQAPSADSRADGGSELATCPSAPGVRLQATLDGRGVLVDVPDDPAADIVVRDLTSCAVITTFPR